MNKYKKNILNDKKNIYVIYIKCTHPRRHVVRVRVAVVVVKDEDCEHHAARHHPLDEVEVGPCNVGIN